MTGKFRLTALDLAEISLVPAGDDPEAAISFFKNEPCTREHKANKACTSCGVTKGLPDSKDVNVRGTLDEKSFRHAKKSKRKKQKELLSEAGIGK